LYLEGITSFVLLDTVVVEKVLLPELPLIPLLLLLLKQTFLTILSLKTVVKLIKKDYNV